MDGWGKRNQRYKKTEEKILAVFFSGSGCTMQKLAKRAGIARSTIYTHHRSMKQIIPDCEKMILEEYEVIVGKKLRKNTTDLRKLYLDTLIFIVKNRQVFEMIFKFEKRDIVMKMLLKLRPKIREQEKIFRICIAEVAEIIFEWGERGFPEREIEKILSEVVYLTTTARHRLTPIA